MSEFHIDYNRVKEVIKSVDKNLADNDCLVRKITYLIDEVRRETKSEVGK